MKEKKGKENTNFNDRNANSNPDGEKEILQKSAFENDFEQLFADKKLSKFRQILNSILNK